MVPTRADRCCYVQHSIQSREQAWEHWGQRTIAQQHGTGDALTESRERSEVEAAFEKAMDPRAGSPATGKSVAGINNLFVDDLFGKGGNETEQRVLTRLANIFKLVQKIGLMWPSQDKEFVGQKIPKPGRTLKLVKKRPLRSWRRSQWNETRRKTSSALLQCIHCAEAFWER